MDRVTASPLAESIVEAVPTALVVLDANLRVRQANPAFYETFQVVPEETEQHDFFELGSGQWDIPWLRASLIRILDLDSRLQVAEVEQVFPAIGLRTMRLEARRLAGPGADDLILLAIEDITERKAAEQQRQEFILLLAHELRRKIMHGCLHRFSTVPELLRTRRSSATSSGAVKSRGSTPRVAASVRTLREDGAVAPASSRVRVTGCRPARLRQLAL